MEVCRVMVLRGEGKSITSAIWGLQKVRMVEHKICTCYGILHVIFVLSKLELVTRHLISFMVLKKVENC